MNTILKKNKKWLLISIVVFILLISALSIQSWNADAVIFFPILYYDVRYDNLQLYEFYDIVKYRNRDEIAPQYLPYTFDNMTFLLFVHPPREWKDSVIGLDTLRNIIKNDYSLTVYFPENSDSIIYRIKRIKLITTEYTMDMDDMIYYRYPYFNEASKFRVSTSNQIFVYGGKFKYRKPRDMKFSIEVEVEIDKNGLKSSHAFTYDYVMTKIFSWFDWDFLR